MVNNLTSHSTAKPFDEFNLTAEQVTQKADKLLRKGYCNIHISDITKALFDDVSTSREGWQQSPVKGESYSFTGKEYSGKISDCVQKLLLELTGKKHDIQPQENELRKPSGTAATQWHHDTAPKLMTVAATHKGRGTEFVSPEVANQKFEETVRTFKMLKTKVIQPTDGRDSIKSDIQVAKDGRFYIFAADGLNDPKIPKLLHRANGDEGRTIFLARFQETSSK